MIRGIPNSNTVTRENRKAVFHSSRVSQVPEAPWSLSPERPREVPGGRSWAATGREWGLEDEYPGYGDDMFIKKYEIQGWIMMNNYWVHLDNFGCLRFWNQGSHAWWDAGSRCQAWPGWGWNVGKLFFWGVKIINHISSIYTIPDNPGNTFPSFWIFWGLR